MRGRLALLWLVTASAPVSAQQCGLPPGSGWTGAGAAALIDSLASPAASWWDAGEFAVWLAATRPWGVAGLHQVEGALSLPLGERTSGALWWRQVTGDGLGRAHGALRLAFSAGPFLRGALAGGLHLLTSPGRPVQVDPEVGLGVVVDRAPVALGVRMVWPTVGHFTHGDLSWACGIRGARWWLRLAGRKEAGRGDEGGLVLARESGGFRLAAGGWGHPLQPVWGVVVPAGPVTMMLEGRWSAGLGTLLLLSVRLGRPVAP